MGTLRYLHQEWIEELFDKNTGYPQLDNRQVQGRSLVKLLQSAEGFAQAYVKFYPEYPLRQQAVDELCYRLSGHSVHTTLIKLTHRKRPGKPYPVLFSQPVGSHFEDNQTLVKFYKTQCENNIEKSLDSYYFTWKFIETYLLQHKDEKKR